MSQQKREQLMNFLRHQAAEKRLTFEKLEELSGFTRGNIFRMLTAKYSPTLDNLIKLSNVIGYDVELVKQMINEKVDDEYIEPKFLLSFDPIKKDTYILHRHFPSCLIQVVPEVPLRFLILDLYDDVEHLPDILTMPFVEEAKKYFYEINK